MYNYFFNEGVTMDPSRVFYVQIIAGFLAQ